MINPNEISDIILVRDRLFAAVLMAAGNHPGFAAVGLNNTCYWGFPVSRKLRKDIRTLRSDTLDVNVKLLEEKFYDIDSHLNEIAFEMADSLRESASGHE